MDTTALAMVTAWLTEPSALVNAAKPKTPNTDALQEIAGSQVPLMPMDLSVIVLKAVLEHRHLEITTHDLALFAATAFKCWAEAIGQDVDVLLKEVALANYRSPTAEPS